LIVAATPADATHGDLPNPFEPDDNAIDNPWADWNPVDFNNIDAVFEPDSFNIPGVDDVQRSLTGPTYTSMSAPTASPRTAIHKSGSGC
jgi:hypothetical protein